MALKVIQNKVRKPFTTDELMDEIYEVIKDIVDPSLKATMLLRLLEYVAPKLARIEAPQADELDTTARDLTEENAAEIWRRANAAARATMG